MKAFEYYIHLICILWSKNDLKNLQFYTVQHKQK